MVNRGGGDPRKCVLIGIRCCGFLDHVNGTKLGMYVDAKGRDIGKLATVVVPSTPPIASEAL